MKTIQGYVGLLNTIHLGLPAVIGELCVSCIKPGSKVAVRGEEQGGVKLLQDVHTSPHTNGTKAKADEDHDNCHGDRGEGRQVGGEDQGGRRLVLTLGLLVDDLVLDARKYRVPPVGQPALVDPHPGDEPGDREEEDGGEGGGGADAERLEARNNNLLFIITWRPGINVTAPTPKAAMSVTLVTVMERPAWARVSPSLRSLERFDFEALRLFQHWVMTNMSSMPMPRQRKGRMVCRGVTGNPRAELRPRPTTSPSRTEKSPAKVR